MLKDIEIKAAALKQQIDTLLQSETAEDAVTAKQLQAAHDTLLENAWAGLTPQDRVYLARHPQRPLAQDYIAALFTDFFALSGDRLSKNDESILGGIALFGSTPVTVIGQCKGKTLEQNIARNFGMPSPEGYRKVQRLAQGAEKFKRPIITFIDTPGAYPGLEAEQHGQGEAIAKCLAQFSGLTVPVIAIIVGEGGSGGALAIGVANTVVMLENAIYSILSPEGFATILWKDAKRSGEACELMKLTAQDLYDNKIIDYIVSEGIGAAQKNFTEVCEGLNKIISAELTKYKKMGGKALAQHRYNKFRVMGACK